MRDETEWVETVDSSLNILVGAVKNRILKGVRAQLGLINMTARAECYGRGNASQQVSNIVKTRLLSTTKGRG